MTYRRFLVLAATLLAVGFGAQAWAHGGARGGMMGGGLVLEELIFPCRAACAQTARGCFEDASATASSCIASACPTQVTAAQSACKGGRSSACHTAVNALRTCGTSCLDARASAADVCRTNRNSCVAACDSAS